MKRNKLIQDKLDEVRQALHQWIREQNLINPGETIVIDVKVIKSLATTNTVSHLKSDNPLLDMDVEAFFTHERFKEAGVPIKFCYKIISNLWENRIRARRWGANYVKNKSKPYANTVSDVVNLLRLPYKEFIKLNFGLGVNQIDRLKQILTHSGIQI